MASAFEEFTDFCKSYDSDLEKMATARSLIQDVLQNPLKPEVADAIVECLSDLSLQSADETQSLAEDGTESGAETPSIFLLVKSSITRKPHKRKKTKMKNKRRVLKQLPRPTQLPRPCCRHTRNGDLPKSDATTSPARIRRLISSLRSGLP